MAVQEYQGRCLVNGVGSGEVLWTDTGLSFWGGVDPVTGIVVDRHHPLHRSSLSGRVLVIPAGRGSCGGSTVTLELLLRGCAPAAFVFETPELMMTLGVLVSKTLFQKSIPMVVLPTAGFYSLRDKRSATVVGDKVYASESAVPPFEGLAQPKVDLEPDYGSVELSDADKEMLSGNRGQAAQIAIRVILDMAVLQHATKLINVKQAHIDACIYVGPGCLEFAQTLASMGARVAVPTTMNAISIDKRRWREIGMDPTQSAEAEALADAYLSMGAQATFTCAPYALDTAPKAGEDTAWGESNAVIFANSVLGARTQKNPDMMEVCVALTGRTPLAGCHLPQGRRPTVVIHVDTIRAIDDATYPVLGYAVGKVARSRIPLVYGLEHLRMSMADLKAFSASFGTSASAPMFHLAGITPEASQYDDLALELPKASVKQEDLDECFYALNTAIDPSVGLVSLGSPHFLLEEFRQLSDLCETRRKSPQVDLCITTARVIHEQAIAAGYTKALDEFGANIITDTCWCMIDEPVVKSGVVNIMTNSGKYAHYGPALVRRGMHFGNLAQCVEAACTGQFVDVLNSRPIAYRADGP